MNRLSLVLPNKREFITTARIWVSSVAAVAGYDVEKVDDIKIAVGEACNNVVLHSNLTKEISLEIDLQEDTMIIRISDEGDGFIPSECKGSIDVENYDGSGLGLYIIHSLMDQVEIESEQNQGTVITMYKKK